MILIIDNYDSFTYNLVQVIGAYADDLRIVRNDKTTVPDILAMAPRGIVISPGPGRPEDAGICVEVINKLGAQIPILGVCLGHQAIGQAFGARIVHAPVLMHGKTSMIFHHGSPLYCNLPNPFQATRYHSLVIASDSLPSDLVLAASTQDGIIMGVRHREYPIEGIQFHPESILTSEGPLLISNWLNELKETA